MKDEASAPHEDKLSILSFLPSPNAGEEQYLRPMVHDEFNIFNNFEYPYFFLLSLMPNLSKGNLKGCSFWDKYHKIGWFWQL